MTASSAPLRGVAPETLLAALRVALGVTFVIGGIKIAFPPDATALATSYIDPGTGWISPFFADQITGRLGLEIATFLQWQGLVEIALGALMIAGIFTPVVAILMALMFWSFTVANPVVGEIRLSRDLALAGLCVSVALAGAGRWSGDAWLRGASSRFAARRDATLTVVRLSLAYTLIASALFAGGVFDNHLNSTLPTWLVFGLGVLLAAGLAPRWAAVLVALWLLYIVPVNLFGKWFFPGLDAAKREIPLLVAAATYAMAGADRWTWPRGSRPPREAASTAGERGVPR